MSKIHNIKLVGEQITAGVIYSANSGPLPKGVINSIPVRLHESSAALSGILSGKIYLDAQGQKVFLSDIYPISKTSGIKWSRDGGFMCNSDIFIGIEYTSCESEDPPIFEVGVLIDIPRK